MKSLLAATAIVTLSAVSAFADDHTVTIEGIEYSTEPSVNSAPGHSVYVCSPAHVERGECLAVDQEFLDSQALLQFGPWKLVVLSGTEDATGALHEVMVLQGGISTGIALKLEAALAANPHIDTLVLASPGGNPDEARAIYQVVKEAELTTWVPEGRTCMSACAEIFLAGKERIITGVVGFHSAYYNWTLDMPTDFDALVDFVALAAQKHQAVFSAQHQAAGLSGEFNMDIAEAAGEFLVFTSSEELAAYSDPNCFDCVDHTKFLRSVDEAQALPTGDTDKVQGGITIKGSRVLDGAGL